MAEQLIASDYAAAVCTCGGLIIRHIDRAGWWHEDGSKSHSHKATPQVDVQNVIYETALAEFDRLLQLPQFTREQSERLRHLKFHIDRNDVYCNCSGDVPAGTR